MTLRSNAQITADSLQLKIKLNSPSGTTGVYYTVLEDLDGDGKLDLAVTNPTNNSVSIFPGNNIVYGAIDNTTFGLRIDLATLNNPISINAADIDNDGKKDLVIGYTGESVFSVYKNASTVGNFSFPTKTDISLPITTLGSLAFTDDFDGDALPDVMVLSYYYSTFQVFRNTSSGGTITFSSPLNLTLLEVNPGDAVIQDFNNDGKKDLAINIYHNSVNKTQIFRNNSTSGSISFITEPSISNQSLPNRISSGDFNKDGKTDLVAANYSSASITVSENTSTTGGSISFASPTHIPTLSLPIGTAARDLNDDGYADLIVCSHANAQFSVFMNKGTGGAVGAGTFYAKLDFSTGKAKCNNVLVKDIDGDKSPELIITTDANNKTVIYQNMMYWFPTTGIMDEQASSSSAIGAFPNPFHDIISFDLPEGVEGQINIFDIMGKNVGTFQYSKGQKLDLSYLDNGIYTISMNQNGTVLYSRVMKN
jgi:hypothetical protein